MEINPEPSSVAFAPVDLRELIGHRETVSSSVTLEDVHKRFGTHQHEFMAVLEGDTVLGVCSRHDIGMRLGARYGFSLFSRHPVREFLSPSPVLVRVGQPVGEVLETVFSRTDESFYDDVLLLDAAGRFLGLVFVHALVRLQTRFLRDNIHLLEAQRQITQEKNQQLEDDLTMAREVQLAMLPQDELLLPAAGRPQVRFARIYRAAQRVGGDFVHVLELSDHPVGIFIADVMGHGVRSALVTAMLRPLVEEFGAAGTEPGELLTHLNRSLGAILRQGGRMMFATALYLIADLRAGQLRYACAGHPLPVRLRRASNTSEVLACPRPIAGPGLCIFEHATYGTAEAAWEGGDVILLLTDGLLEASNQGGDIFGVERFQRALESNARLELVVLVQALAAEAEQFTEGEGFDDDVCLVALELKTA